MIAELIDKDYKEIYKTAIIQQTAYWSQVKKLQGYQSKAFNFKVKNTDLFTDTQNESFFVGDLLIILQALDQDHCLAYVPYGPEIEPSEENQGYFLEQLSESLRTYLPQNCILIRYDLA